MSTSQKKSLRKRKPALDKTESSDSDLAIIEEFCSIFTHEEISFNSWCQYHESPDLIVNLSLTQDEADLGGEKEVNWTRKILLVNTKGERVETLAKETVTIIFAPGTQNKSTILLRGLGDQKKNLSGDLKVMINIIEVNV